MKITGVEEHPLILITRGHYVGFQDSLLDGGIGPGHMANPGEVLFIFLDLSDRTDFFEGNGT